MKYIYAGDELVETIETDLGGIESGCWKTLRKRRNEELVATDFWALKDLTMSQAKKDYRIFLRELPENYSTANEAYDALVAYQKPE
tara:strand:+ start:1317 stop:1574 length:258 start_codon:yes stop_codon:yes gene_type:complete